MNVSKRTPTSWAVAKAVSVELMKQLREASINISPKWINQFLYMSMLYDKIKELEGDVVECGLGEGNTFAMLAYLVGTEEAKRRLYGFDSFEGFPEPHPFDDSPRKPQKGEWKMEESLVQKCLEETGIYREFPDIDINIVKGFVGDTLPHFPRVRKIAFLHVDLDLYEGYKDTLENLWPLVVDGGVVAFDEYREFRPHEPEYVVDGHPVPKWPGCDKAIDDYFKDKDEVFRYHSPTRKYYIIKGSKEK